MIIWTDGQGHRVPADQVIPYLCGVYGTLDALDLGHRVTIDVDPADTDTERQNARVRQMYLVEFGGKRRTLAGSWVIPWLRGIAAGHGVDVGELCDPNAAERARRVQALMAAHQRGWITYVGMEEET